MLVLDTAERLRHLLATDPAFKSPNMNQQCKVCNEPAAGFHFGAFTCEGCKSFFGRTYNNLSSISECKNNGECVINKKNRTSCKACRLRKCLLVGMSKSGSRYGRRSNWFKIHCLLQEQASSGGSALPGAAPPPAPSKEERCWDEEYVKRTPSPAAVGGAYPGVALFGPYLRATPYWPPQRWREAGGGGDLALRSPAPGRLPHEQDQPIDLSVKSSPEVCNKTSSPLDLTKRHQVPLLG